MTCYGGQGHREGVCRIHQKGAESGRLDVFSTIAHEPINRPDHGDYGVPAVDLLGGFAID